MLGKVGRYGRGVKRSLHTSIFDFILVSIEKCDPIPPLLLSHTYLTLPFMPTSHIYNPTTLLISTKEARNEAEI